jgi:hypothetical protein
MRMGSSTISQRQKKNEFSKSRRLTLRAAVAPLPGGPAPRCIHSDTAAWEAPHYRKRVDVTPYPSTSWCGHTGDAACGCVCMGERGLSSGIKYWHGIPAL